MKTKTVSGRRSVSYRIGTTRWSVDDTGTVREPDSARTSRPFDTTNVKNVKRALDGIAAKDPRQRITIDPRTGIVYQDVVVLLDAVIDAGFTNVVFVGSYEQ